MAIKPENQIRRQKLQIILIYIVFATIWIVSSDRLLGSIVSDPDTLMLLSNLKGLLFVIATAILLWWLLARLHTPLPTTSPSKTPGRQSKIIWPVLTILIMVPITGTVLYQSYVSQTQDSSLAELSTFAKLKADQISSRLEAQKSTADSMLYYEGLISRCHHYFQVENVVERSFIQQRLDQLRRNYNYQTVTLLKPDGSISLFSGEPLAISPKLIGLIQPALEQGKVQDTDLYLDTMGKTRWDYLVPLLDRNHTPPIPVGLLRLGINAEQQIFALSQQPILGNTAEIQLGRLENDQVLILNAPTHHPNEALRIRLDVSQKNLPLTAMVKNPHQHTFVGLDEHNTPIFAAMQAIPNTHWLLTAQIDQKEAAAKPFRQMVWFAIFSMTGLLILYLALRLFWRQQQHEHQIALLEQKTAQERLLKHFYDLPFIGMGIISATNGCWLHVNDRLCEILGYSRQELHSMPWSALADPEHRETDQLYYQRVIQGETEDFRLERKFFNKQGQVLEVTIDIKAAKNAQGEVNHLLVILEDETERRAAERLVRHNEAHFRAIFEQAATGIGLLDYDGRWLKVNQRLCQITGYRPEELLQRHFSEITHTGDIEFNQIQVDEVIAGRIPSATMEKRYIHKDGHLIWVEASITLVHEAEDSTCLLAVTVDITERKMAEKALLEHDNNLRRAERVAHFGNWEFNLCTGRLHASNGAMELYGQDRSDWDVSTLNTLCMPEYQPMLNQALHELIQENKPYNLEYKILRPSDNRIIDIHSIAEYDRDKQFVFGVVHDITERKQFEARLEYMAHHDPLTELPNRALFSLRLDHALLQAQRHGKQVVVMLLDLDRFKDVNDSYGHQAGDELLQIVAERLSNRLRAEDTLARLGGDEFGIMLEDQDHNQLAGRLAQVLLETLKTPIGLNAGVSVDIAASIGICLYPEHARSAAQLIQYADAALYQAKAEGRNTFRFYTESLTVATRRRLSMEARLHRALDTEGELQLHYQPQWDIQSGIMVGGEALLRWTDPDEGPISPVEFIPVAEESGLITPLTEWVLREGCGEFARQLHASPQLPRLAINLSPRLFAQETLAERILAILEETGCPAQMLELELTESALMHEGEGALLILRRLRQTGARLALDDFGTGYSSLAYLRRFPLDTLKIDKCFVQALPFDQDNVEIVTAIINLAHTLGFSVLAEGVETEAQLGFLRQHNCEMYQGFLGSKPLPADVFFALARRLQQGSGML